jgi:hypothetical protein
MAIQVLPIIDTPHTVQLSYVVCVPLCGANISNHALYRAHSSTIYYQ